MEEYITEAFKKLNLLEDDFNMTVDADKVDELKSFVKDDVDEVPEEPIIDLEAETEEDLEDTYNGKVILECECCHSRVYKDVRDVIIDQESELANVDEECPVCGCALGWTVIGKIEKFSPDELPTEKEDDSVDLRGAQAELETEDEVEEVDESLKENLTDYVDDDFSEEEVEEACEDLDECDLKESWVEEWWGQVDESPYDVAAEYGLEVDKLDSNYDETLYRFSGRKEDLEKAMDDGYFYSVQIGESDCSDDLKESLKESYSTTVWGKDVFEKANLTELKSALDEAGIGVDFGATSFDTEENEFMLFVADYDPDFDKALVRKAAKIAKKFGKVLDTDTYDGYVKIQPNDLKEACSKDESLNECKEEPLKEDFKEVEIKTDDQKLEMTSDENGKVTVTTEPLEEEEILPPDDVDVEAAPAEDAEEIVPLTDEEEAEIETNVEDETEEEQVEPDADLETGEGESEEEEVTDVDEESVDEVAESFMKNIYHNVKSYKTTSAYEDGDKLVLEGLITFNSGATKKTSFKFNPELLSNKSVRLIGLNETFSNRDRSFNMRCHIENKKLIAESMRYNYVAKDKLNESVQIKGRSFRKK